jgi:hypothetical protein
MSFGGGIVSFNMEFKWNNKGNVSFSTEVQNHAYRLILLRNFSA